MNLMEVLEKRKISRLQLALQAKVTPTDLYLAIAGKKPFYPAWKRRISEYLQINESELFGQQKEGGDNNG